MKLFSKYNRINLFVMAIIFLLSGLGYFFLVRFVLIHELDEALDDYKTRIELHVKKQGTLPVSSDLDDTYIAFSKATKKHHKHFSLVDLQRVNENKIHKYRQLIYSQQVGDAYYDVTIAKELEGTKLLTKTIAMATLLLLLLVIIASSLLNVFILRKLWKPFYKTLQQLRQFKLGNDESVHFPFTDIEEFQLLNENLSATIQQAKHEYQTLKEFTENASHEMQTPVAIVRSKLDLLIQQEHLTEDQSEIIRSAYTGIKRLYKLNQSLLLLAKIENKQYEDRVEIDLKNKIKEKKEQLQEIWNENHIKVETNLEAASIHANESLMDILLNNLFSNAGRHNIEGGYISIHVQQGQLTITNSGSAIVLDADKMFRRFYKGVQSNKNNGLGLSIIKQICDESGIHISYKQEKQQHSFVLSW